MRHPRLGDDVFESSIGSGESHDDSFMCEPFAGSEIDEAFDPSSIGEEFWAYILKKCLVPSDWNSELAFVEHYRGVVYRVSDSLVVVRYGNDDDAFEIEYNRIQLKNNVSVNRGDIIHGAAGFWHKPRETQGIDHIVSREELERLDAVWKSSDGLVRGDIDL